VLSLKRTELITLRGRVISSQLVFAAVILLLLAPRSLWSWARTGHRASALLANSRLTPAAAASIRDLFEHGEDLADISTLADFQREVPNTGLWHYVDVPITQSRYDPRFCQPEK
jgi:hypothetical protein